MSYRLYKTSGFYPNLSKVGSVLWEDLANDSIDFSFAKSVEVEEVPGDFLEECWDSFIQTHSITINGLVKDDLLSSFKSLHKLSFWYLDDDWVEQPEYLKVKEAVPLALEIDFPGSGYLTFYVFIEGIRFSLPPGAPHLTYTITFKSCASVYLV